MDIHFDNGMHYYYFLKVYLLLTLCTPSGSLNVLFLSVGVAGHVTPLFELAKAMKNHNITFLTARLAEGYINMNDLVSPVFRVIYANDSRDAYLDEKRSEHQLISDMGEQSILETFPIFLPKLGDMVISVLNKTIEILMKEQFDVVISGAIVVGVPILCKKINIPCVVHVPTLMPNPLDFNAPNIWSYITAKDMTRLSSRLYNAIFTIHMIAKLLPKTVGVIYSIMSKFPKIPGPFYECFTMKSFFLTETKYLSLVSTPTKFYIPNLSTYDTKYLGVFINDVSAHSEDHDLNTWLKSKQTGFVLYGAFGSTTIIPYDRMYNLVLGLGKFLLRTNDSSILLALRSVNFHSYEKVLSNLENFDLKEALMNTNRVRIEEGFVEQKWILQQLSIKVFLSHCGMGSLLESIYFEKPVLCMPFNMEQFVNSVAVTSLNVGESLFVPPSAWEIFWYPSSVIKYRFTPDSVFQKLSALWMHESYAQTAHVMSLEMRHSGGVQRAVKEIEFYVELKRDFERFAPFESTLTWYQWYLLDLILVYIMIPMVIVYFFIRRCCRISNKLKRD